MKKFLILFLIFFIANVIYGKYNHFITVSKDGSGEFKTVTEALESLPMFNYERVVIYIKNGVYNEKFRITQDYITLKGESKDSTIIEFDQLRTDWIANKDQIGPAVINIHADDIVLENLTIENTQPEIGPHAFAVFGTGTRTVIINCNVLSNGGDTISLWNYKDGMYYHTNCSFKGSVDFVCPRGWCFIKNSKFYELKNTASLWHAGGDNIDQKFVLKNCTFDGVKGFKLGRHHYEAQFYFIDCSFSSSLSDIPIFYVFNKDTSKNRPFNWGERDYFYNCHREGGDYSWFKNNLNTAKGSPSPNQITAEWTFGGKWNPEDSSKIKVKNYKIYDQYIIFNFNEPITVTGIPILKSRSGKLFNYYSGAGSDSIRLNFKGKISKTDLIGFKLDSKGMFSGTKASVSKRLVSFSILK